MGRKSKGRSEYKEKRGIKEKGRGRNGEKEHDRHRGSSVEKKRDKRGSDGADNDGKGGIDGEIDNDDGEMMDVDEIEMMKKLGIPVGFDSTKGKPVAGNDVGSVRKVTKRQPRKYMNRRGGFNRPLPAEVNR